MKSVLAGLLLATAPLFALASEDGIRFDTVVSEGGRETAAQSIWVPFGQEAVIEIPGKVRVVATAMAPAGGRSEISARFSYFANGKWVQDWETSMPAQIGLTPSFEKDLGDGVHRVVVMPRSVSRPSSDGT